MTESNILRLPAVQKKSGLSKSTIYLKESLGEFPKRVAIGARSVGWVESEVETWVQDRIQQSRAGGDHENA